MSSKKIPSKAVLNAKNLQALGAERLAALLIDISTGNAVAKRRLRLELAGEESPGEAARTITKRLATIARSRSYVDWQNRKALIDDLESQRHAIIHIVGKSDANAAVELMWRFLGLADSVFERCDDSSGAVINVFHQAIADIAVLAGIAGIDPEKMADHMFLALQNNGYEQYDPLISTLSDALGAKGLNHLKLRLTELAAVKRPKPKEGNRRAIAWGSNGPVYEDEIQENEQARIVSSALREIADVQGDVDAFIAQYDAKALKLPRIAAAISRRLLAAKRTKEAWEIIEGAEHRHRRDDLQGLDRNETDGKASHWQLIQWHNFEWDDARIDVLDALNRKEEAQKARWSCFERFLSPIHLRAWLKNLSDFDDRADEEQALDVVAAHTNLHEALQFLISWPALNRAAKVVELRAAELDGNRYEILSSAADILSAKHPLAATLVLRSMIDFTLTKARSSRYKHAARHLVECDSLASFITDFGAFEPHTIYFGRILREHGRKSGFWALMN